MNFFAILGDPSYFCIMFIRKKGIREGSVSIQILTKIGRKNKLLKTVGFAKTPVLCNGTPYLDFHID